MSIRLLFLFPCQQCQQCGILANVSLEIESAYVNKQIQNPLQQRVQHQVKANVSAYSMKYILILQFLLVKVSLLNRNKVLQLFRNLWVTSQTLRSCFVQTQTSQIQPMLLSKANYKKVIQARYNLAHLLTNEEGRIKIRKSHNCHCLQFDIFCQHFYRHLFYNCGLWRKYYFYPAIPRVATRQNYPVHLHSYGC